MVKTLIENSTDVYIESIPDLLNLAAEKKENVEVIQLLLDHGAHINHKNYFGWTALHIAAGNFLFFKINDVTIQFWSFQIHIERDDVATIQILIEHGADINARDLGQSTPLASAVYFGAWHLFSEIF